MISNEPIIFKSLVDRGIEDRQPYLVAFAFDLEQDLWLDTLAGDSDPEIALMFGGEAGLERVKRMAELMQEANGGAKKTGDS